MRTPGDWHNKWHFDGARVVPKTVFSPILPLQTKVSYWLTDLPHPQMGNFVYIPGSHRWQYLDAYHTNESVPGEQILCVKKGTMTIHTGALWHRVEPNLSETTRYNLFLCYSPSWIASGDRLTSDPEWLKILNREQRIIMRSYIYGYDHERPPADDYPLFLDRESGLDHDPGMYMDYVDQCRRKRKTFHEKLIDTSKE
ncbi:MAG: phytanoyl-CoA dioxygenase family protein [Moorea sp. SIO3C2]|nr:phytanoyl-CoA dioxygenase family protein [Moorena sp. SIO3C2]